MAKDLGRFGIERMIDPSAVNNKKNGPKINKMRALRDCFFAVVIFDLKRGLTRTFFL